MEQKHFLIIFSIIIGLILISFGVSALKPRPQYIPSSDSEIYNVLTYQGY